MADLVLPRPLAHQRGPLLADARFKVWNWGRRTGKSRADFIAATAGHGPGSTWGAQHQPTFRGILQGFDVPWVAPDFPQARMIWAEEVEPRFLEAEAAGLCKLNKSDRTVTLLGGGTLRILSAENIRTIRGSGKNLGGIIIDEAAHMDLESAWKNEILPATLDNMAWVIFSSTPNAGYDGNAERITPSFYNRLCQEILDGVR